MMRRSIELRVLLLIGSAGIATRPAAAQKNSQSAPSGAVRDAPVTSQNDPTETVGDIVVTAQRREENLQRVPIAISAIDAEGLKNGNLRNIQDLATTVPGFQLNNSSGALQPFLRGVGNSGSAIGNEIRPVVSSSIPWWPIRSACIAYFVS